MPIAPRSCAQLTTSSTEPARINRQVLPIGKRGYPSLSPIAKPARLRTLPLPFEADPPAAAEVPALAQPCNDFLCDDLRHDDLPHDADSVKSADQVQSDLHKAALVAQLAREVKSIEVAGRQAGQTSSKLAPMFTTGCSLMDDCLPAGGYEAGTVIEYLQSCRGSGATTLALAAACEALQRTDRYCVMVDWREQFYPPAAAAMGIDLKRMVIVRPQSLSDRLWAIDQALRSPAIVAVIAEVEHLDDRAARRLQLAAERGGGVGLLIRSLRQQKQPSWAEVQWQVRPLKESDSAAHRQLELQLLRVRGGRAGMRAQVQINATSGRIEPSIATAVLARSLARQTPKFEPQRKAVV